MDYATSDRLSDASTSRSHTHPCLRALARSSTAARAHSAADFAIRRTDAAPIEGEIGFVGDGTIRAGRLRGRGRPRGRPVSCGEVRCAFRVFGTDRDFLVNFARFLDGLRQCSFQALTLSLGSLGMARCCTLLGRNSFSSGLTVRSWEAEAIGSWKRGSDSEARTVAH